MKTRTKKSLLGILMFTVFLCMLAVVSVNAKNSVHAEEAVTYTKVAFTGVEGVSWWNDTFPLSNVINGDETDIATIGSDALTDFFQTDEPMIFTFDGEKAINRIDIALWSGLTGKHTSAYRIAVSDDKVKWAPVKLKDTSEAIIYNGEIVSAKTRNDNHIIVDFEGVICKYVKVTIVIKDAWGINGHGVLSEITAYASSDIGTPEKPTTYEQLVYTPASGDPDALGDVSLINDGKRYFSDASVGGFILFAADGHDGKERYIQFDLEDSFNVSYIRLIPNGWEAKAKKIAEDDESAGYPVNEDALKNLQVAQEYLFLGSTDGTDWTEIGHANDVRPLVCAQTFELDNATAYRYIRLKVKRWNAESPYTSFNEIELFGTKTVTSETPTLKLSNESCKTEYVYNDELDLTNVNLLYKAVGEAEITVPVTSDMVTGYDAKKVGSQTLRITYEGLTVTYTVTVRYPSLSGEKITFTKAETNDTQFCNQDYQRGQIIDGNYEGEVILGSWGQTDFYNFFEPVVLTVEESTLLDNVRVYLKPGLKHTSAFMIEVSNDKENWARVNYIADDGVVIENNAVRLNDVTFDFIDITFEGVTAKYVKVTMLLKECDGGLNLGKITEIEASKTSEATDHDLTFVKKLDFTCVTESEQSESGAAAVIDGKNLYFGQDETNGALILFGGREEPEEKVSEASVTLTLDSYVKANKIRLYPNGYEVKYIHSLNEGEVDANSFVNRSLPNAFTVYGSADGETYVELKKFTDVNPYNFAQEFDISSKYIVKYIKIVVDKLNAEAENFTSFSEIEVFGKEQEGFVYNENGLIKLDTAKQLYIPGDSLDVSEAYIIVTSNDGGIKTKRVKVTEDMVSGFDAENYGEYAATITYEGVTCDYTYAVANITGITVKSNPVKTVYAVGDQVDVTGMSITVSYEYDDNTGSFDVENLAAYAVLDTSVANKNAKLTITYQGKIATVDVVVRDIESITINSDNHKTSYYMGGKLDVTGLTIEVTYTDGEKETVAVTADMVSGFSSAEAKEKLTLTVTYGGKATTYDVEIKALDDGGKSENPGSGTSPIIYLSIGLIIVVAAVAAVFVLRKKK